MGSEAAIRILVVDDNPNDRALATRALTAEFPDARIDASVTNGEEMDRAITAGGFDAVVTDYQLRWATGLDVLRRVKARYPYCPVVMFTNTGTEEVAVEGMKAGLDDYVIKSPQHFVRLAVAVRGAVDRMRFAADRGRVLAELKAAKEQAEAASRLKDEFLAIVSHELRTPLNAILGWATLVRQPGQDAGEMRQGLETIERNARLQARLIDDLLDISRIVSGRMTLEVRPVQLAAVVDAALNTVRSAADAKGIALESHADPEVPPVLADPARLQQVLWNLLTNAIKFTAPGGRVRAEVRRGGDGAALLAVSDTGQGIDAEFLPHVFDRFRQGDASTTRRHGGLGVGLALVKHLVELHGGTVAASSPGPGRGATFAVSLPLAPRQAREQPGTAAWRAEGGAHFEGSPGALDGVRVLVVDDENDARELLVALLSRCGAETSSASSAAQALQSLRAAPPHVLVCDIGMPDLDGYEFVRRLRSAERAAGAAPVPAVALTAFARPEDRDRALAAGYQVHLPKPLDAAELVITVRNLARRPA